MIVFLKNASKMKLIMTHIKFIISRYHTLVKSRTISQLKKDGLLKDNLNLEELLYNYFHDWPREYIHFLNFPDSNTNIC